MYRELNKSLIENQKQWKERIRLLEEQNARIERETALRIGDLEGQVRDLMFYLDTQNKVEQSAHREDIIVRLSFFVCVSETRLTCCPIYYCRVAQSKRNQLRTIPQQLRRLGERIKARKNSSMQLKSPRRVSVKM